MEVRMYGEEGKCLIFTGFAGLAHSSAPLTASSLPASQPPPQKKQQQQHHILLSLRACERYDFVPTPSVMLCVYDSSCTLTVYFHAGPLVTL